MSQFNYQHLFYFYRTAQKDSFSEAARSLHISQPALSMQIKQFETYWGFPLFLRHKRQMALTDEGKTLFEYAQAIFDLGDEVEGALLGVRTMNRIGGVRIGVSAAVPKAIVNSLLSYLYGNYPDLHLVLRQDRIETMINALKTHELDLVVNDAAYHGELQEGIQNHLIATIPMVLCASKALARKFINMPDDLNDAPLILPTAPDQTYHAMQNYIHINKKKPRLVAEIQDLELCRHLVAAGKGIGLLNSYALKQSAEAKKIIILRDQSKYKIQDTIYVIMKQRKIPHPITEHVIAHFRLS